MDDGLIVKFLVKVLGRSWKTSLLGIIAILPQLVNGFQFFFLDIGVSAHVLNSMSIFFTALAAMAAKAHDVTGTDTQKTE